MILNLVSQAIRAALAPPGETDPFFNNVTALLHFDGANGSTTFTDATGRTWTAQNSADIRTDVAKFGSASGWFRNTPGSGSELGSRITTPDSPELRFGTDDFTVEGWFIPQTPLLGFGTFFRKGQNTAGGLTLAVTPTQLALRADGITDTNVAVSLSTSEWSHIAFTREAGLVRFFVNGLLVGSATRTFNHTDTEALFIGSVAGDTRYAYNGRIDDLRITKGVARYTENFTPPAEPFPDNGAFSFASLLHFDGINGSTDFIDETGVVWTRTGTPALSTTQAKFGVSSLEMLSSGTNYIEATSPSFNFGTGDFCIECWYRPNATTNRSVFCFGGGTQPLVYVASNNWGLYFNSANVITGGTVNTSTWYHVVLNRYIGVLNLFINGVRIGQYSGTGANGPFNPNSIRLGQFNAGNPSGGFYDELRITKGDSVYQNVTSFTPPARAFGEEPVVSSLMHFDGADGSTDFTDVTGKAWTRAGNAQISTAQSKFGVASMLLDGTGDYIFSPSNPDFSFGFGDFTVEWWAYQIAEKTVSWIDFRGGVDNSPRLMLYNIGGSRNCIVYVTGAARITSSTNVINFGVWQHFAVCRASGTTRLFIDGVSRGSFTDDNFYTAADWSIGRNTITTARDFNGYIDEFQAWKGLARYTSNFTPPAAPFPDP